MGLFDMFKGDTEEMTPHLAFATSLLYMMSADGEMDNEEVGHLLSVLGGENDGSSIGVGANNEALLQRAMDYARNNHIDDFLAEVSPMLTDAQKMCILVNLLDSSLSDGDSEVEEQELFLAFLNAFEVSEERFRPFFEVVVLKNDRSVFTNVEHPSNQNGYRVQLSK